MERLVAGGQLAAFVAENKASGKPEIVAGMGVPQHMSTMHEDFVVVPNVHVPTACG